MLISFISCVSCCACQLLPSACCHIHLHSISWLADITCLLVKTPDFSAHWLCEDEFPMQVGCAAVLLTPLFVFGHG